MCQVRFAALILSICVCVRAGATDTPSNIRSDELIQIVAAGQNLSDAELAQKLAGIELTDRLSVTRLADLTGKMPGEKSRLALLLISDRSIFMPPPPGEIPQDAAPTRASAQQMLINVANYVNATVRQLPNLMATRFSNGFEDQPREEGMGRTGLETTFSVPLHWVGSLTMKVTYRDRHEIEDKSMKVEKKGNGVEGLVTTGEFGPVLSTVLSDASKSNKLAWTRWEKGTDGTLAVFHYQVPKEKSNFYVNFVFVSDDVNGRPRLQVSNERSAYHGDIVFNPSDGSIRLLTEEADEPAGALVSSAGIAIEYAATDIGGRSYICPARSVSMLRAHISEQSGAVAGSGYNGPLKTFLNDVKFSNYRRFGTETKVLTDVP